MSIASFLTKKFLNSSFFPAHNRGKALPLNLKKILKKKPGVWDLPELPEIGTPLSDRGLIADAQRSMSMKFNTKKCFFGVNGASGLIQSGIISMANPGECILMPRNVHICVIKACAMLDITPVFFDIEFDVESGHYKPISRKWFNKVIRNLDFKNKKVVGVVLVNPYYQGYSSELEPLIKICHQYDLPVLVDEAHGSYFLFCQNLNLPQSAVKSNADLVIHSLHKSLNGLTQTAVLWYKGNLINEENLVKSIGLLQTTSPSSLLLSSCEEALNDWNNIDNTSTQHKRILEARAIFRKLIQKDIPLIKTQDPLKIILNTSKVGIDGFTADKFFYENGLVAELPEMMTLTFCLGFANQRNFAFLLEKLWKKLLMRYNISDQLNAFKPPFKFIDTPEVPIGIAWRSKSFRIPLSESIGKISADIICPYPPGIPLIVPGERIDNGRIEWIKNQSLYNSDLVNSYIRVLKNEN